MEVTTKANWLAAGEIARRRLGLGPFDMLTPSQVCREDLEAANVEAANVEADDRDRSETAGSQSATVTPIRGSGLPDIVVVRASAPEPAASPPVAYDLHGAAEAVSLSVSYLRRQLHSGKLRGRMIDRKYRISHADLQSWFDRLPQA